MAESKKRIIEYLDINDDFYVENDELKMKMREDAATRRCSWDEMWDMVEEIIVKMSDYEKEHNQGLCH